MSTLSPADTGMPGGKRYTPATRGVMFGLTAYLIWGCMPLFMHPLSGKVPVMLILSHRVAWSVVLLAAFVTALGFWGSVVSVLRDRRTMAMLVVSTLLISCNWAIFTYLATHGQVLQTALGYFLNPIISALLGFLILKERMRPLQWAAVAVALAGVTFLAVSRNVVPREAIAIAVSWGFYGLVRKLAPVDAVVGLTIETAMLFPFALGWIICSAAAHTQASAPSPGLLVYLAVGCGLFTTVPLLCFSKAAKLLPLSALGFLQYVGPTLQFVCAVAIFGEVFTTAHAVAFALIWTGVALFITDALLRSRQNANRQPEPRLAVEDGS